MQIATDRLGDATTLMFVGKILHAMTHHRPLSALFAAEPSFIPTLFALMETPRAAMFVGVGDLMYHLPRPSPSEHAKLATGELCRGGCGPNNAGEWFNRAVLQCVGAVTPLLSACRHQREFFSERAAGTSFTKTKGRDSDHARGSTTSGPQQLQYKDRRCLPPTTR